MPWQLCKDLAVAVMQGFGRGSHARIWPWQLRKDSRGEKLESLLAKRAALVELGEVGPIYVAELRNRTKCLLPAPLTSRV